MSAKELPQDTQLFLLAAGRGRRAGGPKAWREEGGRSALENLVEWMLPRVGDILVSVQAEWRPLLARISPRVRWISVDPDLPALASLQELVLARGSDAAAFVHHVDMPLPAEEVLAALRRALPGWEAAAPVYQGKRGHPVLLSRVLFDPILELDRKNARLDTFLRARKVVEVPVEKASVLENKNE